MKIVDTHIHVWDFERAAYPWLKGDTSILNRTWKLEEIANERIESGITSGVLVQAGCNLEDTGLMLEIAHNNDWIDGVVGWLPLTHPEKTNQLLEEKYLKEKYFKGVRHLIHDEKDSEWLLQPSVIESLKLLAAKNIPYDMVGVLPAHLETTLKVIEKVPTLHIVLDHLNAPPIPEKVYFGRWGELMKEVAQNRNIYAKISGLGTAGGSFENRTPDDIKPYITYALEIFGADRCFCGGDWPVSMLANSYFTTWQITKKILNEILTAAQMEKVFFSNANSFYKLGLS
ncbi:MAG: amidohydrolase family protein [Chitinophagaceae bacterium]